MKRSSDRRHAGEKCILQAEDGNNKATKIQESRAPSTTISLSTSLSSSVLRRVDWAPKIPPRPKWKGALPVGHVYQRTTAAAPHLYCVIPKGHLGGREPIGATEQKRARTAASVSSPALFIGDRVRSVTAGGFVHVFAVLSFSHLSEARLRRSQRRSGANIHSACRSRRSNLHSSPLRFPIQVLVAKQIPSVHSAAAVLCNSCGRKYQDRAGKVSCASNHSSERTSQDGRLPQSGGGAAEESSHCQGHISKATAVWTSDEALPCLSFLPGADNSSGGDREASMHGFRRAINNFPFYLR